MTSHWAQPAAWTIMACCCWTAARLQPHDGAGADRTLTVAPCDHFEWHPPHMTNANSCAPDFNPSTCELGILSRAMNLRLANGDECTMGLPL